MVSLDFGDDPNIFNGEARWLEIAVRPDGGGGFDTLTPRTELGPTPYSLHTRGILVDDSGNVEVAGSMVVREWLEVGTGTVEINRPENTISFTTRQGQTSGTIETAPGSPMPLILNAGATGDIQLNPTSTGNVGIGTNSPDEKLHVAGNVKIVDGNQEEGRILTSDADGVGTWQTPPDSGIPAGGIIMWSGQIANIPAGWALCDGNNNTPDLRDRFIVGARQDDSGIAMTNIKGSLMQMGGEHEHTLTIPEMPNHTHTYDLHRRHCHFSGNTLCSVSDSLETRTTGDTGGGQPHENCPPFYALAFIMRTGS